MVVVELLRFIKNYDVDRKTSSRTSRACCKLNRATIGEHNCFLAVGASDLFDEVVQFRNFFKKARKSQESFSGRLNFMRCVQELLAKKGHSKKFTNFDNCVFTVLARHGKSKYSTGKASEFSPAKPGIKNICLPRLSCQTIGSCKLYSVRTIGVFIIRNDALGWFL